MPASAMISCGMWSGHACCCMLWTYPAARDAIRWTIWTRSIQNGNLGELPQIIVCNKMDLPGAEENLKRMKVLAEGMGCPVFPVSAATREGFEPLLDETAKMLETLPPILHYAEEEEEEPEQKLNNDFAIERDGEDYVVTGAGIERLMESVNFDDLESLNWFHRTLRRIGVIDALREQGAGEGSTVRIGEMEFDFVE